MPDDPDSPRVVARLPTEVDAAFLVEHLRANGIPAMTAGAGTSTGWPEAPGDVQVVVPLRDLERAAALREQLANRLPRLR